MSVSYWSSPYNVPIVNNTMRLVISLRRFQWFALCGLCSLGPLGWACGDSGPSPAESEWIVAEGVGVRLYYKSPDRQRAGALLDIGEEARRQIGVFAGSPITGNFDLRVYPDREEFEAYWRESGFTPQCWMIARATRVGIEMLAPRVWAAEECGHDGGNATELQRVVTHEAMHVLHARVNPLPEVNHLGSLKWFNEGIAVYSSQQLNASMRSQSAQFASGDLTGVSLSSLGLTSVGYSVGGSITEYIDQTYGRAAVLRALRAPSTPAVLDSLHVSEAALLTGWKAIVTGP